MAIIANTTKIDVKIPINAAFDIPEMILSITTAAGCVVWDVVCDVVCVVVCDVVWDLVCDVVCDEVCDVVCDVIGPILTINTEFDASTLL